MKINAISSLCVALLLLFCGCGGDSNDNSSGGLLNIDEAGGAMSGQWQGTLFYRNGTSEPANFVELIQDGANISGTHELFSDEGRSLRTEDVSGTVDNTSTTISVVYRNGAYFIELVYEGTFDGHAYSGDFHLTGSTDNYPNADIRGNFTFTKVGT